MSSKSFWDCCDLGLSAVQSLMMRYDCELWVVAHGPKLKVAGTKASEEPRLQRF